MKFSVIIPCYNSSKTIVDLLEQLNSQSVRDFEVILVDDCSKDNTVDVIRTFKESHDINIRIIQKEKNSGPGVSRNIGIKEAKGDFLCFIDSDDKIADNYLAKLQVEIDKGSDVVYFNIASIIGNKIYPSGLSGFPNNEDYIALSWGSLCMFCSKRELWYGLELPAIKNAEDIAVIPVVMSRASNITMVADVLYYYVNNPKSLSNTSNSSVCDNFMKSFEFTLQNIDKNRYFDQVEFHGIKTVLYGATLNALKANVDSSIVKKYWSTFINEFPDWYNNKYLVSYPLKKKFFLFLVRYKLFVLLRCYTKLHAYILKNI